MIVDRISRNDDGADVTLSGRVRTASLKGAEFEMFFRVPSGVASGDLPDASPFLPPLYLMSMFTGERLTIDGPVSARLLEATEEIADVCSSFWPGRMRRVAVDAPAQQVPCGRDTYGCFFSGGVDSWYSVLTEPGFTHLLHLTTFHPPPIRAAKRQAVDDAAAGLPQQVVHIDTNVYEWRPGRLGHQRLTGAYLAAVALASGVRRVAVPSTAMRGELGPLGSHPLLDRLFSTERTELVHHGAPSRLQKVQTLAHFPEVLDLLDVCALEDEAVNCGACEKCLRTMLELHAAGAPAGNGRFARPLRPERVAALRRVPRRYWTEALHALGESALDRRLAAAVSIALARSDLAAARDRVPSLRSAPALGDLDGVAAAIGDVAAGLASADAALDVISRRFAAAGMDATMSRTHPQA